MIKYGHNRPIRIQNVPVGAQNLPFFQWASFAFSRPSADKGGYRTIVDQQKAKALFWQAQEILGDDLPTIPVYYMYGADASIPQLYGFVGNPTNAGDGWNMEQWYLKH